MHSVVQYLRSIFKSGNSWTMNMVQVNSPHKASCHCGGVKFDVTLTDGLNTARRCNCSICRMRGAIAVTVDLCELHFTQGEDMLALYQFNTGTAKHYFCSRCGIYTHHQRRSNPMEFGVNVACLEGLSPFDIDEVAVLDGNNHPSDTGKDAKGDTFGILKFIKADN